MLNNSWNYGGVLNQDGGLLIGVASGNPTASFLTSSAGTLSYVFGPGSIDIEVNFNGGFLFPLIVGKGGTSEVALTISGVLIGEGSNGVNVTATGTDGQLLIASSTGDPQFSTISSTGGTLTFFFDNNSIDIEANLLSFSFFNPLQVQSGGSGNAVFTVFGVLLGEGSNKVNVASSGTNPSGRILIASSTGDPKFSRLTTRVPNMLTFAFGYNTLNIEANVSGNTFFNPLQEIYGGTGHSILTVYGVLIGEGSNALHAIAGTSGQVLIASSTGDPKFVRITSTGGSITFTVGYNSLNVDTNFATNAFFNPLKVGSGGTGRTVLTVFGLLVGEGSNQIAAIAVGTNGQLLIASSTGNPKFASVTSTGNSLTFTFGYNSLDIEPTFALSAAINPLSVVNGATGRTVLTVFGVLIGEGSNNIRASNPGTNGQVLIASSTGDPQFATITSTGGSFTFVFGYNSLNVEVSLATDMFFNPLAEEYGGTGQTILTTYGVLIGEGSNQIHATAAGTNGQVLIAGSTGDPAFMNITSAGNSITFAVGYNSFNVDTTLASAQFFNPLLEVYGGTGRTILTTYGVLIGEGSNSVNMTAAGTNGQLLIASSTGDPQFYTVTSVAGSLTFTIFTRGYNSLNMDTTPLAGIPYPILAVNGATGRTVLTSFGVLIGEGSNSANVTNAGTNGQVLIASSTGDPQFASITSTDATVTLTAGYNSLNIEADFSLGPLPAIDGGTGNTVLTLYGVLIGEGSNPLNATAGTNGQMLIASSTGDPLFATITSSAGTITFTFGYNSLNMEFVTAAAVDPVTGGGTGLTVLTTWGVLIGEGSNNINVTDPGTNGQVLIASSTGDPAFATITSTGGSMTFTFGYNSLNIEYVPLSRVIIVPNQGTGQTVLTAYGVLIGEGTNNSLNVTDPGTNGQVLIASSTGDPAFATITSSAGTFSFTAGYNSLNLEINALSVVRPVSGGGTGQTVLTTFGVLHGEGLNSLDATDPGTNGQVLIASSTGDFQFTSITSTGGSFAFSVGYNSLNIDIAAPLNINFGGTGNTLLTTYGVLIGEGSMAVDVTNPGTNGQVLIAGDGIDPAFATITSTGGTVTFSFGYNSLNMKVTATTSLHSAVAGGTGRTVLTLFGVLIGEGSNNVNVTAAGTNGQLLIASSTGDPKFVRVTSTGGTMTFVFGYNSLNVEILFLTQVNRVSGGGTGRTVLTAFGVLIGEGSNNVNVTVAGTSGQAFIASSTGDPKFAFISSTGGTLALTFGQNSMNVDINGVLDISLGGTKRAALTTFGVLLGESSLAVNVTAPGTNGQLLIASSTGDPKFATLTSTGGSITFTFGYNRLNMDTNLAALVRPVEAGGTGRTVLTAYGVLVGEGSNNVNVVVGTNGQTLIASSTGDPQFVRITSTGNTLTFTFGYNSLNVDINGALDVAFGGTERAVLTTFGVLLGEGSLAVNVTAPGTNGQALIASSAGDPIFRTITSTGDSITFTFGYNRLNMDTNPGAIMHPVSAGGTGRTVLTAFGVLIGEGSNNVNVVVGTNGQTLIASTTGDPKFVRITSTGNTLTFTFGYNSLNVDVNGALDIAIGGTDRAVLTTFGVLVGEGSLAVNVTAPGTNGQTLIASSTGDPIFRTITSTGGSITFAFGYNRLNMDIVPGSRMLQVSAGGTGRTVLTTFGVLIGAGSNSVRVTAAGTDGQVLIAGTGIDPKFARITSTGNTLTFVFGPNSLNIDTTVIFTFLNPWPVVNGGTGTTILTTFGVLIGDGSNQINVTAAGTNGQTLIAGTGVDPKFASITSTGGSMAFTTGYNSLNVAVASGGVSPDFGGTGQTILTTFGVLIGEGSNNVHVTAAGTNGQTLIAGTNADPKFSTITSTGGTIAFTAGFNSLNLDVASSRSVASGGTGRTTLTAFGVLIGEGSNPINVTAAGTNGQLLIAESGADPAFSTVTSTGGTIVFTRGSRSLNIETNVTFTFANVKFSVNSVTGVTSSAVTSSVSTSFNYYAVDTTNGTVTLQFPASAVTGRAWIVKDRGGMSDLNPIRITTAGGTLTFDGQTFFNLTNPFGAVQILYNGNAPAHYEII